MHEKTSIQKWSQKRFYVLFRLLCIHFFLVVRNDLIVDPDASEFMLYVLLYFCVDQMWNKLNWKNIYTDHIYLTTFHIRYIKRTYYSPPFSFILATNIYHFHFASFFFCFFSLWELCRIFFIKFNDMLVFPIVYTQSENLFSILWESFFLLW